MFIIILTTVLTLSALYAPQPLLPVIVREFAVSSETAALLTTVAFIPLSLAPLVYGFVLETVSPRRMLKVAVFLLAVTELWFYYAPSFAELMVIRLLQGLLIPAMLTALMTYVSEQAGPSRIQRAMAVYVTATILGGFLGRACSGFIATTWGWRHSFLLLAISLAICFVFLFSLKGPESLSVSRPKADLLWKTLSHPLYRRIYLLIFCLFLVFAAIMNFLPFRLTEISDQANEFRIGLMYSGYVMGMVTSLMAVRFSAWLGGSRRAILAGMGVFCLALLGLATDHVTVLFVVMFLFCGAMFLVHSTATGHLNRLATSHKGVVNGVYVAFYYGGGVVGSYLPGLIYKGWGWLPFILCLLGIALVGMLTLTGVQAGAPPKRVVDT
ncbi:MFS transporter [Desulfuromonas sp. AOP6]|uniref:MFS transporter n=1 Tax=Desulfuromonas sp. AOP6 TaxID=1566351 RepID=UPI00126E1F5E|nr:MFS transporter [Desulfuromonas sp. AOP6]BCA80626.1 MFS transporter [Desulfuromonas sp. AOP6]